MSVKVEDARFFYHTYCGSVALVTEWAESGDVTEAASGATAGDHVVPVVAKNTPVAKYSSNYS